MYRTIHISVIRAIFNRTYYEPQSAGCGTSVTMRPVHPGARPRWHWKLGNCGLSLSTQWLVTASVSCLVCAYFAPL